MAVRTFAAIDVGSTDITMKIYEITSGKKYRQLDYVSNIIELGSDTYKYGYITQESLDQLIELLKRFAKKMREYGTVDYCAYATSAIREAKNSRMVLDLIKLRTGINVSVLTNIEHRFLMYKGLAVKTENFDEITSKNSAIVDIGSGSVQITLMNNHRISLTQNIPVGALRVRERLRSIKIDQEHVEEVMEELISNEVTAFRNYYLGDKEIKHVIAIGDEISYIRSLLPELMGEDSMNEEQLEEIFDILSDMSPMDLATQFKIPYERATTLLPATIIYRTFLTEAKADIIWTPDIDLCDGIIVDNLERNKIITFKHDFKEDALSCATMLAKRYKCYDVHNTNVASIAGTIFDKTKKIHGFGAKERLQLEIAALLHDIGKFVNVNNANISSYYIIMGSEIMGLSDVEKEEVATMIRYNSNALPDYESIRRQLGSCDYMKIAKLSAILKVSNAMDRSHRQKANKYNIAVKDNQLVITIDTLSDLALERGLFGDKADFFQRVYGIRPVLKQKQRI